MAKNKLLVKHNNGNPVILCHKCSIIIKYWKDFTQAERDFTQKGGGIAKYWMLPQYCDKCYKYLIMDELSNSTKHKQGYTSLEMVNLCDKLGLDKPTFYDKLGVNTCMVIDGEVITYHCDVELAVRLVIEDREMTQEEWD